MNSKSNSHSKSSSFIYSTFTGKIDTTPREVSEPWPQIIKRLSKPAIRANKDGPLWSPATFKPARRKKENVKAVSLLVLDIDGGMTIDQADAKLRELGAQACIYSKPSADWFDILFIGELSANWILLTNSPDKELMRFIRPNLKSLRG